MNPQVEAAIIAAIATVVGVGGTVLVGLRGFRATKQATDATIKAQREQLDRTEVRTLNERFATAAGQLGSDKPPEVRLAGVYAMAGLADDWEENRQTCVDVLCSYLRMPYKPDPGAEAPTRSGLPSGQATKSATLSSGSSPRTFEKTRRCPGRA
jgi:hypothetical protein